MSVRWQILALVIVSLCVPVFALAQSNEEEGPITRVPVDRSAPKPKDNRKEPPRSDQLAPDESSSKQTEIDISPPNGDKKKAAADDSELNEFHPWDPLKAAKCIEVGDFYFKQGNYRAAISRYQEALEWKPKDAEATYKLGEVQEKTGDVSAALANYQDYLKILPNGPYAEKARKGMDRVKSKAGATAAQATPKPS
ncbi:MAG TPA: tetratricopeptide repeat protein [Candidatus Eisenbacteria bacterium]|nr:tetratricopeptide repeat protein [Candidatus Eisenbacteria bacterium]